MGRTTLTLHDDVMTDLVKVMGLMESENGKRRSLEDTVKYLIDFFKKHKEGSKRD
jgi:hypothetical protein